MVKKLHGEKCGNGRLGKTRNNKKHFIFKLIITPGFSLGIFMLRDKGFSLGKFQPGLKPLSFLLLFPRLKPGVIFYCICPIDYPIQFQKRSGTNLFCVAVYSLLVIHNLKFKLHFF
jgi:hypothetical protein